MGNMFGVVNGLSTTNMNQIHSSFFSNSNWPYDWSIIPLNDTNFQTAVDLWFSDQSSAISTYGHIKDWNVSGVTSMASAFKDRTGFNENITGWDVSNVTNMGQMFKMLVHSINQLEIGMCRLSKVCILCLPEPLHLINRLEIGMCLQ